MANYTTNEQALLTYLEEELLQTQTQYQKYVKLGKYWASYEPQKDMPDTQFTYGEIDYLIINAETQQKLLMFRMKWLESQINEVKNNNE